MIAAARLWHEACVRNERMAPSVEYLLPTSNTVRAIALGLLGCLLWASGCGDDACALKAADVDPAATFSDGQTPFSVCSGCPVMSGGSGTGLSGPVTRCQLTFDYVHSEGFVSCCYANGGAVCWSGADRKGTDTVGKVVPNRFDFCRAHCPDDDELHECWVSADASGITQLQCQYGLCGSND